MESSGSVHLCARLDSIKVVPVKAIKSVVSMFCNLQVTTEGEIINTNNFSLLRHPFLELATLQGGDILNDTDDVATGN